MKKGATKAPTKATAKAAAKDKSPSHLIDARIKELGDWRGKMLAHIRALIRQALPRWSRSGSGAAFPCGITTG